MTSPSNSEIAKIIDLDRYPLHRLESQEVQDLISVGQKALESNALYSMPGFVRATAVTVMAEEMEARVSGACRFEQQRIAYTDDGANYTGDHPRNFEHPCAYHQVLNYQIPNDSYLRSLFYWEPLREFLRQVMGYETFHRSECPHLALSSKIAGSGDTDGWHFDSNDVVFSILLQAPEKGGQFEYVPNARTLEEENYDALKLLFQGGDKDVVRPAMATGDFNVFKGDLSMHRVTPVEGDRRRIVGLFCFDQQPGTFFDQSYIEELQDQLPLTTQG